MFSPCHTSISKFSLLTGGFADDIAYVRTPLSGSSACQVNAITASSHFPASYLSPPPSFLVSSQMFFFIFVDGYMMFWILGLYHIPLASYSSFEELKEVRVAGVRLFYKYGQLEVSISKTRSDPFTNC